MTRRPLVVAALATSLASPAPGAAGQRDTSLQRYLSSMSWPVRAAVARADSLARALDCAIRQGDPPCWRGVAANCRALREVEAQGHLLLIAPPATLRESHAPLRRAYDSLREACVEARRTALAAAAGIEVGKRDDAARVAVAELGETEVVPFVAAARAWRGRAGRAARTAGVRADWLQALEL